MDTKIGIWIDHRMAMVLVISEKGEERITIFSHAEKQPGRAQARRSTNRIEEQLTLGDRHAREYQNHLHEYYEKVISHLEKAESVLIMGPGEAKGELKKLLEATYRHGREVVVEPADKMTERQFASAVRRHFLSQSAKS